MFLENFTIPASLRNAVDELGFTRATVIQEKAFSAICSGSDVCGIAQTGTGKTFAYLIPLMRMWKYRKENAPYILVLVPTRELVMQVIDSIEILSKYMNFESAGVYGGVNINTQRLTVERKLDIVVGTPGRLFDLAMNGSLKLKKIRHLVIDEMDEMLSQGFLPQIRNIMDLIPDRRQNLLFSATITEEVSALINLYFKNPLRIEAAASGTALSSIEQIVYEVPNFYTKKNLLEYLFTHDNQMQKVLIFVSGKKKADLLFESLSPEFLDQVAVMHGNKAQNTRFQTVKDFDAGNLKFLIATDIISRGIDVQDISHVINFDMPDLAEDYMHRIGRTGRADKQGLAISFVSEKEIPFLEAAEQLMQLQVKRLELPEAVEISTALTDEETDKPFMPEIDMRIPVKYEGGGAFHPKSAKNSKVNFTLSKKERMMQKYGKPKTRGQKKKKR